MNAGTEKGQFDLGYAHKVMMEVGVHFKHEIHWNNLLRPKR